MGGDAGDRADIDHPRRVVRRAGLAQQRQQLLDAAEHRGHVELHDFFPTLGWVAFQRRAPGGASVVDQDIQLADFSRQLGGQRLHAFFAGQVGGDAMAGSEGREFAGGLRTGLAVTGAQVNRGAGFDKAFGDHFADTAGATGDQGGAALQGEVRVHGESFSRESATTLNARPPEGRHYCAWECSAMQRCSGCSGEV
ncbi:hypothetical protein FQZ97_805270 [compost metagenome]